MSKFGKIGHNSIMIPHDGKLGSPDRLVAGAKFTKRSFFRPTGMSVALSEVGAIPDVHLMKENRCGAWLRHRNDEFNQRPSVYVAL